MIKKKFGLIKRYYCDRCAKKIGYNVFHLCENCYAVDPICIRHFQVNKGNRKDSGNIQCCLCNSHLIEINSHQVCLSCISAHPDNSHHDWTYRIPPDDIDIKPGGLTWANHCFSCGSVQIARRNNNVSVDFSYFRKGNKISQSTPFICPDYDLDSLHREMKGCVHEWVVVAENISDPEKAGKTYNELKNNPVREFMGWEDAEVLHIAYGEKSNWCWKCGCFYITSPGTNRSLPQKGLWE